MELLKTCLNNDLYRIIGSRKNWMGIFVHLNKQEIRFLFFLRFTSYYFKGKSKIRFYLCKIILRHYSIKYGYEIPYQTRIASGVKLMHFGAVAINPLRIIRKNVTINKGVTIGSNRRGENKGAPIINEDVFIGSNAAIIGKIVIGSNVLIAPNSFVNFDVPNNSIVLGNPGVIVKNYDATKSYRDNYI
jgi:serine O-acetyltransferase